LPKQIGIKGIAGIGYENWKDMCSNASAGGGSSVSGTFFHVAINNRARAPKLTDF
jgi:hypothetical protein